MASPPPLHTHLQVAPLPGVPPCLQGHAEHRHALALAHTMAVHLGRRVHPAPGRGDDGRGGGIARGVACGELEPHQASPAGAWRAMEVCHGVIMTSSGHTMQWCVGHTVATMDHH